MPVGKFPIIDWTPAGVAVTPMVAKFPLNTAGETAAK
jgi:hypothetical protein